METSGRHIVARLVVARSGEPQGFELRAGDRTFPLNFEEAEELATTVSDELRRLLAVARGMQEHDDEGGGPGQPGPDPPGPYV